MKKWLFLGLLPLLLGLHASKRQAQANSRARAADEPFIGSWRLAWLELPGEDGQVHRVDSAGLVIFSRDGHISVQVMDHSPRAGATSGPQQYSQGGYEASYGTYKVDEKSHTFTFHVDGALVRTLVGKDLPRAYEFRNDQLIIKSTDSTERWRAAWERY